MHCFNDNLIIFVKQSKSSIALVRDYVSRGNVSQGNVSPILLAGF